MQHFSKILTLISLLYMTCVSAQEVDELNWMIGTWELTEGSLSTVELWVKLNDSTLIGKSDSYNDGDLVFSENLRIENRGKKFNYVAILPSKTAVFKLDELAHGIVSFVDPENDFPSRITYRRVPSGIEIVLFGSGKEELMVFRPK